MGSRIQPNHGGSGKPHSRRSRPKPPPKKAISYRPIQSVAELLLYLSGDKIACLICGGEYKSLGHHLSIAHSISPKQYKIDFNIPVTRSLCGEDLKERKKAITERTWQESPKMEGVRKLLKENIVNLHGTMHKSKSTLVHRPELNAEQVTFARINIKLAKKVQDAAVGEKYRAVYLAAIQSAIEQGTTLYEQIRHTGQIYSFARRNPDDVEFNDLLAQVKKPNQLAPGEGTFEKPCDHCGKIYQARVRPEKPSRFCSRSCASAIRKETRLTKHCAVCNKAISMTPSDYKKLSTCGDKKCKSEHIRRRYRLA
jgi:hypothetical protein